MLVRKRVEGQVEERGLENVTTLRQQTAEDHAGEEVKQQSTATRILHVTVSLKGVLPWVLCCFEVSTPDPKTKYLLA